jgi:hypothetical protein
MPRRRLTTLRCLTLAIVVSLAAMRAGASEPVGLVIDTVGQWSCTDDSKQTKPLVCGDRVPGGATVRPVPPLKPNVSITIVRYDGKAEIVRSRKTFQPRPSSTISSRLWNAIVGAERTSWASAIARGELLDDGVAKLDGEHVDLSSIFSQRDDGKYLVRLRRMVSGKAGEPVVDNQEFVWKHESPQPLAASKISAGLYDLEILTGKDQKSAGAAAWVLVLPPDRFASAAHDYREVVAATDAWPADVSPLGIIGYRRAYLESLVPSDAGRGQ